MSDFFDRGRWKEIAFLIIFWFSAGHLKAANFLFDNTKAETAGNADWVIDQDSNVAGRFPTPAASGITASTPESYWLGGLSAWGVALVKQGHSVETLPASGRISYGDATNPQDLGNYRVYVICEPNILFSASEKTAIVNFVLNGGRLFIIGNHSGSDRNNDGEDPVEVWNDLFHNNPVRPDPFGLEFNPVSVSLTTTILDSTAGHPLTRGAAGNVTAMKYSSGATMTIRPEVNPGIRAAIWRVAGSNADVMAAYGTAGLGRFVAIGDSSPPDDGTGAAGNTLYPGWTDPVSHGYFLMNASLWLAEDNSPPNDAFANATVVPLPEGAVTLAGTSVGATREIGEAQHGGVAGGGSVWWRFTAATDGFVTAATAGSGFDTLLAVYTGDGVGETAIASNDDADGTTTASAVTFPITAGTVYSIAVDRKGAATGEIVLSLAFPEFPAPGNDHFADAFVVPAAGGVVSSYNAHATVEVGEPAIGASVWWKWTAPTGVQSVTISTSGSTFDTNLGVYTGGSLGELVEVAADTDSFGTLASGVRFAVTAGETYRIFVVGNGGATGNVSLAVAPGTGPVVRPMNDALVNSIALSGINATASGSNDYATAEAGEPGHAGEVAKKSLWWTWTAPRPGLTTIHTGGSDFPTRLSVYTGGLELIEGNDSDAGPASRLVFNAVAGTSYRIAIDGRGGASGKVVLSIAGSTAPINDLFADATLLEGTTATATGTNDEGAKEAGEPNHAGNSGGKSVWWKWTSPQAGTFIVTTNGSDFDTTLGIYTGSTVNGLQTIGGDDDSGDGTQSLITLTATAGGTYHIAVDGYNGATGAISLRIRLAAAPENDAFASATSLSGEAPVGSGSNLEASAETAEPDDFYIPQRSLWWAWTAPADGFTSISTAGSNFNTVLNVYTGSSLGDLTLIVRNDDANGTVQSQVSFAVTAGTTYRISVDGSGGSAGSIVLAVNGALPAPAVYISALASGSESPLSPVKFVIALSIVQPRPTVVNIQLNGTAQPGVDFTAPFPLTGRTLAITVAPLASTVYVDLMPVADSDLLEFAETVIPTLPSGVFVTLSIADHTPYAPTWVTAAGPGFTAGNSAMHLDPDGDGATNLLEAALNGNPLAGDAALFNPVLGFGEFAGPDGVSRTYATLTFLRKIDSPFRYVVKQSTTLDAWTEAGVVSVGATSAGAPAGFERVTYRAAAPMEDGPVFLRLEVSWP